MRVLIPILLICSGAVWGNVRVFVFNKTDGGASFRLQCASSPEANRCAASAFNSKGEELCEDASLKLKSVQTINCVESSEGGWLCKYATGQCVPEGAGAAVAQERRSRSEGEQLPDIERVEELPSLDTLPPLPSPEDNLMELPSLESFEPIESVIDQSPAD